MSDVNDEGHSSSWDHSTFMRTYNIYLDQHLELMLFDVKGEPSSDGGGRGCGYGDDWFGLRNGVQISGYRCQAI